MNEKFAEVLNQSDIVSEEIKNNSAQIIKNCVDAYKNGEYHNVMGLPICKLKKVLRKIV